MTTRELREIFNAFGLNSWPKTYEVDADTYGHVVHDMIEFKIKNKGMFTDLDMTENGVPRDGKIVDLIVGPNNGILYKNVELILK